MNPVHIAVPFDDLACLVVDALAFIAADERVATWSEAAAGVTGIPGETAVGRRLDDLFSDITPGLHYSARPAPMRLWTRDEHRRGLHASVLSVEHGWLMSFGHEQRFAQIDELKGQIVASVSHELKTPIATIKAYATTLRSNSDALEDASDEYLQTIEREADRLNYAVDDLLSAGRVDVEYLPEWCEHLTLDAVLDAALDRLDHAARPRVVCEVSGVALFGDRDRLAAALAHVIENALNFSPLISPVTIDGRKAGDSTVVRVIDRGIGIAPEQMPYIFDRFYRGDARLAASNAGSGLGLYVARSILRAHGGSIDVESEPGTGTIVTLRIPVRG